MKAIIKQQLIQAANKLISQHDASLVSEEAINQLPMTLVWTRDNTHGDLASNLAMLMAKLLKQSPRLIAEQIVAMMAPHPLIETIEIAGPGFINFFLSDAFFQSVLPTILDAKEQYGRSDYGSGQRVHIEYVSANPTGPLHVGHGRGAAHGATVANLLSAVGFDVHREYYVNDAGRQMAILAVSVWLRYLDIAGWKVPFPVQGYKGHYVNDIAQRLYETHGDLFKPSQAIPELDSWLNTAHAGEEASSPAVMDKLIEQTKSLLGEDHYNIVFSAGLDTIEEDIRQDLAEFGVTYDSWFRESRLVDLGLIETGVSQLAAKGHVYEKDGALWFKATALGDEKDRVLRRTDGRYTYFASDVAYHLYKYQQGFDKIINVFGADHHGYIARIQAFLKALDCDTSRLTIAIVQFAILWRGKTRVSMSTRGGEFVSLRELRNEVGNDAARFFYLLRKVNQHLDFDLELATSHSQDNPVYYVQYAHARICSVLAQAEKQDLQWQTNLEESVLSLLKAPQEKALLQALRRYPECIEQSAIHYEPHVLVYFLQTLATTFHSYYNSCQFIISDRALSDARLCLVAAVKQVLSNGLALLGVSAPDKM